MEQVAQKYLDYTFGYKLRLKFRTVSRFLACLSSPTASEFFCASLPFDLAPSGNTINLCLVNDFIRDGHFRRPLFLSKARARRQAHRNYLAQLIRVILSESGCQSLVILSRHFDVNVAHFDCGYLNKLKHYSGLLEESYAPLSAKSSILT